VCFCSRPAPKTVYPSRIRWLRRWHLHSADWLIHEGPLGDLEHVSLLPTVRRQYRHDDFFIGIAFCRVEGGRRTGQVSWSLLPGLAGHR
jgi:hypothetical protein